MINPPIVADIQLEHRPTALMPNGITFVVVTTTLAPSRSIKSRLRSRR